MSGINSKVLARSAMVAGIYTVLSFVFPAISFGPIQLRISEILCVLPYFGFYAVPGLAIGCLVTNIIGYAMGLTFFLDIFVGTIATLAAAIISYNLRQNKYAVGLPPVITNSLLVGAELHLLLDLPFPLHYSMIYVGIGEFLSAYVLGTIMLVAFTKNKQLTEFLTIKTPTKK